MNFPMISYIAGVILSVEGGLMLLPLIVSLLYRDGCWAAFAITIALLLLIGLPLARRKPQNTDIYASDGYVIVAGAWIVLSLFGALPFLLSGEIPNYIDAIFETVSAFTTTGSSILRDVEAMSKSMLFWRSFAHWIGGMGVLVFIMAILPLAGGRSVYLMRAESPGPSVGKLAPKIRSTAKILYGIYIFLTILEVLLLCLGGMPFFDSLLNSFASVATGGFGIKATSIAWYDSAYFDIVITVFMILCGINFNLFYLILMGHVVQALKSEELRWYLGIILLSTIVISLNILPLYDNIAQALRYAVFQVASIITTTGFATADFNLWPGLSRMILVVLMFLGASAGSTGGGLKISRFVILMKSIRRDVHKALHPRAYSLIRFEEKTVDEDTVRGVSSYFALYMLLMICSMLLVSLNELDFTTTVTAVISCFNNIGPGLEMVGPMGSFADFTWFSKLILTIDMLFGRLELIPLIMLVSPAVWKSHTKRRPL